MLILSNSINPFKKYADKFQPKCINPCLKRVYHIPQSYHCSRNFGIFLELPPETLVYFLSCILNQETFSSSTQHTVAQLVKNLPAMQETWVHSLGWGSPGEGKGYPHQHSKYVFTILYTLCIYKVVSVYSFKNHITFKK